MEGDGFYLAKNPIIVSVDTDKSLSTEESFLRIVLNGTLQAAEYQHIPVLPVSLSQPVSDGGTATFNLSDAVQGLVQRIQAEIDMNQTDDASGAWFRPIRINGKFKCKNVWLRDNVEQSDGESSEYTFHAVPGGLTDYEFLMRGTEKFLLSDEMGDKPMSRKPDMGIVYKGETVILPLVSVNQYTSTFTVSVGGTQVVSSPVSSYLSSYSLDYLWGTVSHNADGALEVSSSYLGSFSGYYRTNTQDVHFLRFINGFGAVENISVRAKDKLSYEVSGETHSLVQEASVQPTDRRYATKSQPVGVYELSSGYVPRKWAEWYVQELLTSPRVWIQLGGKWIPALIEAEDDCVIYDRTKPEMPHVDFTLRLAIDGVTGVTW